MFTCSLFLTAGLAVFKLNQALQSSGVIGAQREKDKLNFKNGGEVKR